MGSGGVKPLPVAEKFGASAELRRNVALRFLGIAAPRFVPQIFEEPARRTDPKGREGTVFGLARADDQQLFPELPERARPDPFTVSSSKSRGKSQLFRRLR